MDLSPEQEAIISSALETLFETIKAKFLGQFYTGPAIYFEIAKKANPLDTVSGIFEYALRATTNNPIVDSDLLSTLADTTGNYIEAEKKRAYQRIVEGISTAKSTDDITKIVEQSIEKSNNYMGMLIPTETRIS